MKKYITISKDCLFHSYAFIILCFLKKKKKKNPVTSNKEHVFRCVFLTVIAEWNSYDVKLSQWVISALQGQIQKCLTPLEQFWRLNGLASTFFQQTFNFFQYEWRIKGLMKVLWNKKKVLHYRSIFFWWGFHATEET